MLDLTDRREVIAALNDIIGEIKEIQGSPEDFNFSLWSRTLQPLILGKKIAASRIIPCYKWITAKHVFDDNIEPGYFTRYIVPYLQNQDGVSTRQIAKEIDIEKEKERTAIPELEKPKKAASPPGPVLGFRPLEYLDNVWKEANKRQFSNENDFETVWRKTKFIRHVRLYIADPEGYTKRRMRFLRLKALTAPSAKVNA